LALRHFQLGNERLPGEMIHAYGVVKYCAAASHQNLGSLDSNIAEAIMQAAKLMIAGKLDDQFPLSIWQSGSGTQSHMNVNEVLATLATEQLDGDQHVHPNDHCNLGQSTNDSFPTALHIACVLLLEQKLLPALNQLQQHTEDKAQQWQTLLKSGRTHLQDATPIALGQEFSAYASQLAQAQKSLQANRPAMQELTMGGTAVGTGINTREAFADIFCREVSQFTGYKFKPAENFFAAQSAHDAIVQLSGSLNTLASSLNKMASDIRLMASGPRCGLGEITLPANEPGSSIMPGKVNPSQCEMLNMVCAQIMGNHTTLTIANAQGQFQLNTFKPLMALNILQSLRLLADAIRSFDQHCLQGIAPVSGQLQAYLDRSLMLITALTPVIGYDRAARVVQLAVEHDLSLRDAVIKEDVLSPEEFDRLVQPELMIHPRPDR
jgi:fumarate hydratase class II